MVMVGVIRSKLPITTHAIQMKAVKRVARWGSRPSAALKYLRTGRMSSLAIAASSRGAPVRVWSAAPKVESMIPT